MEVEIVEEEVFGSKAQKFEIVVKAALGCCSRSSSEEMRYIGIRYKEIGCRPLRSMALRLFAVVLEHVDVGCKHRHC